MKGDWLERYKWLELKIRSAKLVIRNKDYKTKWKWSFLRHNSETDRQHIAVLITKGKKKTLFKNESLFNDLSLD